MQITKHYFGNEQAPLLMVDNFFSQTDKLIQYASELEFLQNSAFYPGVRAVAPLIYQQTLLASLSTTLIDFFALPCSKLCFSGCHYSVVSTPPEQLKLLQRIPHFDSLDKNRLAAVHYLFKGDMGGTSFYRHRKTGFESMDESRQQPYFASLESENDGSDIPKKTAGYINGDTALYERIEQQPAVFNRLIIYRGNSLHSGSIPHDYRYNGDPLASRFTISSFIDCA